MMRHAKCLPNVTSLRGIRRVVTSPPAFPGEFLGTTITDYRLQFNPRLQTLTGTADGKIFKPGVNPVNPGPNDDPFFTFHDEFVAQRVPVGR